MKSLYLNHKNGLSRIQRQRIRPLCGSEEEYIHIYPSWILSLQLSPLQGLNGEVIISVVSSISFKIIQKSLEFRVYQTVLIKWSLAILLKWSLATRDVVIIQACCLFPYIYKALFVGTSSSRNFQAIILLHLLNEFYLRFKAIIRFARKL